MDETSVCCCVSLSDDVPLCRTGEIFTVNTIRLSRGSRSSDHRGGMAAPLARQGTNHSNIPHQALHCLVRRGLYGVLARQFPDCAEGREAAAVHHGAEAVAAGERQQPGRQPGGHPGPQPRLHTAQVAGGGHRIRFVHLLLLF